jgi:putative Mg2+ transporter-C (MgtC) family protein
MPELSWLDIALRLVVAAGLGGAVGLERQLRERGAGLRTHMLVGVGSALFTMVSAYAWTDWRFSTAEGLVFDPTRIAAQIVSGIGFLGAGAIIRQGFSIRGLTTAATLWVVAAIGMASGVGYYAGAVATTAIVLVALGPLGVLSRRLMPRAERARLLVTLPRGATAGAVLDALDRAGARVRSLEFEDEGDTRRVVAEVALEPASSTAVITTLMEKDEVLGAEWTE